MKIENSKQFHYLPENLKVHSPMLAWNVVINRNDDVSSSRINYSCGNSPFPLSAIYTTMVINVFRDVFSSTISDTCLIGQET